MQRRDEGGWRADGRWLPGEVFIGETGNGWVDGGVETAMRLQDFCRVRDVGWLVSFSGSSSGGALVR